MIHLIHGIHTAGASPIEGLASFFASDSYRYPDYGFILGIETRAINPIVAGSILPYINDGDIIIGHSNGCAIAYDLAWRGAPAVGLVFVNAALDQMISRPKPVEWIDVYFNAGDEITEAAKIGAVLDITDPVWGEMGHAGYSGRDAAIVNIDCGNTAGLPRVSGHSDFFSPANLPYWGAYLANRIRSRPSV